MTPKDSEEIKACIEFYESKGYDWSDIVEFLVRKANGTLPEWCYVIRGLRSKDLSWMREFDDAS